MKLKIFTTLAITAICLCSKAQIKVDFGVEGGATSTKIRSLDKSGDENNKFTADGGFYLGGLVQFNRSESFSVQTGLRFSQINAKELTTYNSYPGITVNGKIKMNAIEVPVNLIFQSSNIKCKWFGFLGPQFNVALSGNKKATITTLPNVDEKIKFGKKEDEFKRLHTYMVAGIGCKLNKSINATAAYHFGISDIDNTKDYETKFNSFRVGLQYFFTK